MPEGRHVHPVSGFPAILAGALYLAGALLPALAGNDAARPASMPDFKEMQRAARALKSLSGKGGNAAAMPMTPYPGAHNPRNPHMNLPPGKLLLVALQHLSEGRGDEAMKTLNFALRRYPDDVKLRGVRASLHLRHKRYAAALADLEVALKHSPDDPLLLVNRAQAYRGFKRNAEALADLDHALKQKPGFIGALFNRGALLFEMKKYDAALKDFEKVAALDPHLPAARFNIAMTLDALGRRREAMKELEDFLKVAKHAGWRAVATRQLNNWRREAGLPPLKQQVPAAEKASAGPPASGGGSGDGDKGGKKEQTAK